MRYHSRSTGSYISRLTFVTLAAIGLWTLVFAIGAGGKTRQKLGSTKPASVGIPGTPVTVGTAGNEPIVTISPDGTLYISALQHMYLSIDGGAHWTPIVGPPEASQLNLNSDSSISVDPGNRLYFTFDYPYLGTTAVCTSDDKGVTWSCNPAVVPGGTDRMWVIAPSSSVAYEVTNQGAYETAFLVSTDRGATWTPKAIGSGVLEPQSGPLLMTKCSGKVFQPIKIYGTLPSDVPELKVYVYDPGTSGAILSDVRPTGLGLPAALPSGSFSLDGVLYVCSEEPNGSGGRQVVVARSADQGVTWTKLPALPATAAGTATFTSVATGAPGHVGVLYYYTPDNGDPATLSTSNWSAMWAESYNADTATPTWTVTTVENLVHTGALCVAADCMGSNRFAGDFITAIIDSTGAAHLTWMAQPGGTGTPTIRYQRIQSGPVSTYVSPACGVVPLPVQLMKVVSRKSHGGHDHDIDLPVTGPHGIECRSGGASGEYTMIFTFVDRVSFVGSASVSSGSGEVKDKGVNPDNDHQYIVNLKNVADAQHIFVTLRTVQDSAGHSSDAISAPMSVLFGDVNATGVVTTSDVQLTQARALQTLSDDNFRSDVDLTGDITTSDVELIKANGLKRLP